MAVDCFLKLDDIKGESVDDAHKDEIQVLGWSWGMSQTGTTHRGTGGGAGKVNVNDLTVTKYVDTSTPTLTHAVCTGKHFKEAVLTGRKAGEKPLDYLVITMQDVIITSMSTGGSDGDEQIVETVTLNFASFKESYQPQDNTGAKAGGAIEIEYFIAENK